MKTISIGEAAAALRIPESTLRYYEKQGLLPLIERDGAGRRLFSEHQMELLETILRLKHTHMPIQDIRQYIAWVIEGESTTELRLEMMTRHKQTVLNEMAVMEEALRGIDIKINRYTERLRKKTEQGKEENL
ncbi:MerR family transcriptional regulator [Paenibacillus typhae]|uniref:DNA-binding transcriptional regulator, MerR family n=1 Tax=Paenibacillus typhae TaxID=1174501 RepID=A0A1G8K2B1_9BACL|nr:MerR family transcriptional regulator [Paenibacillus typhae]SDI37585.1 DNA-binding transcriptional regulator, MerR family [Paenibacillus typhae]